MFTDGDTPYPNLATSEVIAHVSDGKRCACPPTCPAPIYKLFLRCWNFDEGKRPTFTQILRALKKSGDEKSLVRFDENARSKTLDKQTEGASQHRKKLPNLRGKVNSNTYVSAPPLLDIPVSARVGSIEFPEAAADSSEDDKSNTESDDEDALPKKSSGALRAQRSSTSIGSTMRRLTSTFFLKNGIKVLDEESMTGKAHIKELFFDLVFVAALYRLGAMIVQEFINKEYHIGTRDGIIIFSILWLSWYHFNMLKTRFHLQNPWNMIEYVIMLLTLFLGICMVSYENTETSSLTTTAFPKQSNIIDINAVSSLVYADCNTTVPSHPTPFLCLCRSFPCPFSLHPSVTAQLSTRRCRCVYLPLTSSLIYACTSIYCFPAFLSPCPLLVFFLFLFFLLLSWHFVPRAHMCFPPVNAIHSHTAPFA